MKNKSNIVNIFWSGGWDSTFRIVELSRMPVMIQPIYAFGDGRKSEKYERQAMNDILSALRNCNKTVAKFNPMIFININDIPEDSKITEAYNLIHDNTQLGSQHEWLACIAKEYSGIEIGTEAAELESSRILTALNQYGHLIKDEKTNSFYLDTENSTREGLLVFGNITFPIIDKTKIEMKNILQDWGDNYINIMMKTWFCHTPISNKPCGFCHPCMVAIEGGMTFRVSSRALKRYNIYKKYGKYKVFSKVFNAYRKFRTK